MARTSIKSTYALDVDTVRKLDRMAARWRVSKSEVLRRAIDLAANEPEARELTPVQSLEVLQKSLELSANDAENWAREARRERKSGSLRREWRKR
ncbi:MAG: ribbon-helix-helix protein, CopG family [Candidatus Binataceae bacterium]